VCHRVGKRSNHRVSVPRLQRTPASTHGAWIDSEHHAQCARHLSQAHAASSANEDFLDHLSQVRLHRSIVRVSRTTIQPRKATTEAMQASDGLLRRIGRDNLPALSSRLHKPLRAAIS
jgi:hypothetical protein